MKLLIAVAALATFASACQFALGQAVQVGVKECAACHTQPGILYPRLGVTQFVRLSEATQWFTNDKHALAYELIRVDLPAQEWDKLDRASNRKTREIVSKLGWTPLDGNLERQCLTCHAGVDTNAEVDAIRSNPNLAFGVQCESCHGPGSLYTNSAHHQQPTWRTKSTEEKGRLGMLDLSNAAVCAEVCLTCHLGDIERGRFVTHEMFAAGHPPLPPFELQTFLDAMPPHWGELTNKPYRDDAVSDLKDFQYQREYYRARFDFDPELSTSAMQRELQDSFERTKRSQIGALITQDMGVSLIHQAANQPGLWGDYALYDCMGCHQTLTKDRPRFRSVTRIPGRAFPPQWISINVKAKPPRDAFDIYGSLLEKSEAAFNRVPFGDASQFRELAQSSSQIIAERSIQHRRLGRELMDADQAKSWLKDLFAERREKLTDFWVARQTAWMIAIAINELVDHGKLQRSDVAQELSDLEQLLQMELRTAQTQSLLKNQSSILGTANTFDSSRCRELLDRLVDLALQ